MVDKIISYQDKLKAYYEREIDLPYDQLIDEDKDRKLNRLAHKSSGQNCHQMPGWDGHLLLPQ
jgi:hypothetical protein